MDPINTAYFGEKFNQLQSSNPENIISDIRNEGFKTFNQAGLPTFKNEEWKYTKISTLFNKEYQLSEDELKSEITVSDVDAIRLPGFENANELVFANGKFAPELSTIRSSEKELVILPLDHIADARENHTLAQPRSLVFVDKSAKLQVVETYATLGSMDSFTNEVVEIVVDTNAIVEYYKIQNDKVTASQVGTTHIRQIGKSYVHAFAVSLNGGMIRNNTDIIMEAAGNEAHMYGLYLLNGRTHVDNHTLVDNTKPNCFSNEFYKGIIDDYATGVFSGKIFVRPDAQKTNAYQSNKNILLSDHATVNTKPQLEIFADDVKCSHGCTVGQLDEEALFYLRTRGIGREHAQSMLLQAFAADIVEQVKIEALRNHVENLITQRLSVN